MKEIYLTHGEKMNIIDMFEKEEVKSVLIKARTQLLGALMHPKGLVVQDFHDIQQMTEILKDIIDEKQHN